MVCPRQGTRRHEPGHGETREAFIADLAQVVYDRWELGNRKIAHLEMVVILQALLGRPHRSRE